MITKASVLKLELKFHVVQVAAVARQFAVLHNALKFEALHLLSAVFCSDYSTTQKSFFPIMLKLFTSTAYGGHPIKSPLFKTLYMIRRVPLNSRCGILILNKNIESANQIKPTNWVAMLSAPIKVTMQSIPRQLSRILSPNRRQGLSQRPLTSTIIKHFIETFT
ncbi:hypothetical protein YC2023_063181 [Brassica napus]